MKNSEAFLNSENGLIEDALDFANNHKDAHGAINYSELKVFVNGLACGLGLKKEILWYIGSTYTCSVGEPL